MSTTLCQAADGTVYYCQTAAQTHAASPLVTAISNPVVLLLWVACAALCMFIAAQKNRPVGIAVIAGLLLSVIAVVIYALLPTLPPKEPAVIPANPDA